MRRRKTFCRSCRRPTEFAAPSLGSGHALGILEQLTVRYRDEPSLWAIEVLKEPISPEPWDELDVPNRYPAVDKAYAEGSEAMPTDFLKSYYRDAYARIRENADDLPIVFHDGFRIKEWVGHLTEPDFENFVVDTHMYVMMRTAAAGDGDLSDYTAYIEEQFGHTLKEMSQHFPLMVGEWCLDTKSRRAAALDDDERADYWRAIAAAHFRALEPARAWTYWAYKLHSDAPEYDVWDLEKAIELGYFPMELSEVPAATV